MTVALHPRVAEVIAELETAQRELEDTLHALTPAQRDATEGNGGWSVAQIVEHLAMVEDGSGRLISKLIGQAEGTTETDEGPVRHLLDHFRIDVPDRKIEAPEMVQPKSGLTVAEALTLLATARGRVIEAFERASGRDLGSVIFPHPALGPLNVYAWGLFLAHHQRRHVNQLRHSVLSPSTGSR